MELDFIVVSPKHVVREMIEIQMLELMCHFGPVYFHLRDMIFIKIEFV